MIDRQVYLLSYGLSAELEAKRKANYNPELEQQARQWLQAVVGEPIGPDFQAALKDGVYLYAVYFYSVSLDKRSFTSQLQARQ